MSKAIEPAVSDCCSAPVRVVGAITLHYECTRCGKACDATGARKGKDRRPAA